MKSKKYDYYFSKNELLNKAKIAHLFDKPFARLYIDGKEYTGECISGTASLYPDIILVMKNVFRKDIVLTQEHADPKKVWQEFGEDISK